MDSFFAKSISLLLFLIFSSFVEIQSRESKFFSKVTHVSTTTSPSPTEAPTPSPAPASEPTTKTLYNHFGPGSGLVIPAKETTNTPTITGDDVDDFIDEEELVSGHYQTGYQNDNFNNGYTTKTATTTGNDFNSKQGYQSNNFNNGYTTTAAATTSNFNSKAGYSGNNYVNNGYGETVNKNEYTRNYNTNGYDAESGRQGMSDTRYVEGGRYFHDVKNDNNYPQYGHEGEKDSVRNEGYYGNTQDSNEFNTMEEYYKENQEQYVP